MFYFQKNVAILAFDLSVGTGAVVSKYEVIRNSVKLILLNPYNQLLLLSTDDQEIQTAEGQYHGKFWQMVGGKIEEGETINEAIRRELYEETGLKEEDVVIGNTAWYGEVDLIMYGAKTRVKQSFVIVRTKKSEVSLQNLTNDEIPVIKTLRWFSLEEIKNCPDLIYPILLKDHLPDIIVGKYPQKPINIDLTKKPAVDSN